MAEWQTQQTQNLPTINRVGSSPTSPTKIRSCPSSGSFFVLENILLKGRRNPGGIPGSAGILARIFHAHKNARYFPRRTPGFLPSKTPQNSKMLGIFLGRRRVFYRAKRLKTAKCSVFSSAGAGVYRAKRLKTANARYFPRQAPGFLPSKTPQDSKMLGIFLGRRRGFYRAFQQLKQKFMLLEPLPPHQPPLRQPGKPQYGRGNCSGRLHRGIGHARHRGRARARSVRISRLLRTCRGCYRRQ